MQIAGSLGRISNALVDVHESTLEDWSRILEKRDLETRGHSFRVVGMAVRLAEVMGLRGEQLLDVRRGALLHDIGKLKVPAAVLHKQGPLNKMEEAIVHRHPQYAYEMLKGIDFLQNALDIPYCHHEKWDGSGYPRGLKGEEIPLSARIFAVVDVFDAMDHDRSYRAALPREETMRYLKSQRGKHFDPNVLDVFLTLLEPGD